MDNNDKERSNLAFGGLVAAFLLAIGIIVPQLPLEVTRPAPSHVSRTHYPYLQETPARLWEDPLAVAIQDPKAGPDKHQRALEDLKAWILEEEKKHCISLMPVLVPGGPYGEYAEQRRRIRYAVVSALNASRYSPSDFEHIGYVELDPRSDGRKSLRPRPRIPFEWYVKAGETRDEDPACKNKKSRSTILLWLDEDLLWSSPLKLITRLADEIGGKSFHKLQVIGPASSDALGRMYQEVLKSAPAKSGAASAPGTRSSAQTTASAFHAEKNIEIFSWGATAPAAYVVDGEAADPQPTASKPDELLVDAFRKAGVTLYRPIPDDSRLIDLLLDELHARGFDPHKHRIAILSESETVYGNTLKAVINRMIKRDAGETARGPGHCSREENKDIYEFNYMRGLDGETAHVATTRKEQRDTGKRSADPDRAHESAAGQAQLDYARRISANIRDIHDSLRDCKRELFAIGVLGTDFYDKSLLLQALRKEMPQALYFTTDLDARMIDANQNKWTRNLVVVSGFGLQLRPELQKATAPFRDSYQTSAYLSALLAINSGSDETLIRKIEGSINPRTYEIGRQEIFDFGSSRAPEEEKSGCTATDLSFCATVERRGSDYCELPLSGNVLALTTAVMLFLTLATVWSIRRSLLESLAAFRRPLMWVAAVVLGLMIVTLLVRAQYGTHLEPLRWTEGISTWPTTILRLTGIALAVFFMHRLWHEGSGHLKRVLERFFPGMTFSSALSTIRDVPLTLYRWVENSRRPTGMNSEPIQALEVVQEYMVLARFRRRLVRVLPVAACYLALGGLLIFSGDPPNLPARGLETRLANQLILAVFVLLYTLLLFFVVDAVRLFNSLIERLMQAETTYPAATVESFSRQLGIEKTIVARYCDDWIDMQFIAARTESTARLIFYPFIILAIALVARSQLFDNWHTPAGLSLIFVMGAWYAVHSAYQLRNTAERARSKAINRMSLALIRAHQDPEVTEKTMKQLELLRDNVRNIRDGALAPLGQQPFWKAILFPLGGFGGAEIIQYLLLFQK